MPQPAPLGNIKVLTRFNWWVVGFWLLALSVLVGCTPNLTAKYNAVKNVLWRRSTPQNVVLNPELQYLRTTVAKQVVYLVYHGTEKTPNGESVEVWLSGEGEVIKMYQGRISSTAGLPVDWREVQMMDLPSWNSALNHAVQYERIRDVMPGYHYGLHDTVDLSPSSPPKHSLLVGIKPQSLRWFVETTRTRTMQVPPARYAVSFTTTGAQVIYSEQCLSAKLCIAFQRWRAGQTL